MKYDRWSVLKKVTYLSKLGNLVAWSWPKKIKKSIRYINDFSQKSSKLLLLQKESYLKF